MPNTAAAVSSWPACVALAVLSTAGPRRNVRRGDDDLLQRRRLGATHQHHRRLDDRRPALDEPRSSRSSASTSSTTPSRAGARCSPSCRGREGYTPDNVLSTMRRLSGQLGSVLVIMGGYDDPGYGFACGRRRGDGRGGTSGHSRRDVADDAHRRRLLRRTRVRLQHLHVPRQQPDPAAEGPAVRRSAADRRLGHVLGEPPGVVLRRRDPLPGGRDDGRSRRSSPPRPPACSPARRSRRSPARSRSCRGSQCAAATGAPRSSRCSGR